MTTLFDPVTVGKLTLKNRIFMAPLTRGRAGESRIPNALMAQYYAQRAGAGLIISEATAISPEGYGWKGAPALYTDEQEAGWRPVTEAVHKAGGRIFMQLWHMGRVSHPDFQGGKLPLAPSAIAAEGFSRSLGDDRPYVVPRPMTKEDIQRTIADYASAATRAIRAGFDGVEIHGANGYLIDQFLRDGTNRREDEYGGRIENRLRFMIEVTQAVTNAVGSERTGIRLSPMNGYNSMFDSNLAGLFTQAAEVLDGFNLAYMHVREPSAKPLEITPLMRDVYRGIIVANDGYDLTRGNKAVVQGAVDAVAFGVPFIANPDLVERLRTGAPLNAPDTATFYNGGKKGYTDYPFLSEAV